MRGYLCFAASKSEANFSRGETGYHAPQVGTFGVALDSVFYSYEDLYGSSERIKELLDKGRKNGLYSEKNYVNKVPYGTVVYVDSWLEEEAIAVVKLCVITNHGKTIGVRNKWAVLQWDWDYDKDDEDRDYREFTDWLDLEDQAVINGLELSYRPEVLKDPEKLVYKVKDVKDEITGADAGVVGPTGPKPERSNKERRGSARGRSGTPRHPERSRKELLQLPRECFGVVLDKAHREEGCHRRRIGTVYGDADEPARKYNKDFRGALQQD